MPTSAPTAYTALTNGRLVDERRFASAGVSPPTSAKERHDEPRRPNVCMCICKCIDMGVWSGLLAILAYKSRQKNERPRPGRLYSGVLPREMRNRYWAVRCN